MRRGRVVGCSGHHAPVGRSGLGAPPPVALAAAAFCLFLCFLCGFSRSAAAGRCAAGSM